MSAEPRPADAQRATVLVLDDDPQLRSAAVRILARHGYRALGAETAAEALQIVAQWRGCMDLLVCDLVLPGLSGREAASALQARHPEMKVLFMSGFSSHDSFRREMQEGGDAFLAKPFGVPDLLAAVEAALAAPNPPDPHGGSGR